MSTFLPRSLSIEWEEYAELAHLPKPDAQLLVYAQEATEDAYAPYSNFRVGAAIRLENGVLLKGSNQENASFPVGLCAERTVLSSAASNYPGVSVVSMAITIKKPGDPLTHPVPPCGNCRQALMEVEKRFEQPIRLILQGMEGPIYVFERSTLLLPFSFGKEYLSYL